MVDFAGKRSMGNGKESNRTRKISPLFGLLGILGLTGFLGPVGFRLLDQTVAFYIFFAFFGFFSFYFEGKMSNTLMDERFLENKVKAESIANNVFVIIIFFMLFFVGQQRFMMSADAKLIFVVIVCALALSVNMNLRTGLLYYFDKKDTEELEEEE